MIIIKAFLSCFISLQIALRYKTIKADFSLNIVVTGFIIVDVSMHVIISIIIVHV